MTPAGRPLAVYGLGIAVFTCLVLARPKMVNLPRQGMIEGTTVTVARLPQRISIFLGLPYASPPINQLRFAPPKTDPLPSWMGIRSTKNHPPTCLQSLSKFQTFDRLTLIQKMFNSVNQMNFSEDCLYLNLYVPEGNPPRGTDGWPVIIWFHPGDFMVGSPNLWDGSAYAAKNKMIVVVPGYRLGIFGFFTTNTNHSQGNFGLMDQVAAMDWVKEQIKYFNGSPNDITIMGHSAGGVGVTLHLLSDMSSGKFHKAIAMSGNALQPDVIKDFDEDLMAQIPEIFCSAKQLATEKLMSCLREVLYDKLINLMPETATWGPVIDGNIEGVYPFLKDDPQLLFEQGMFHKVPFVSGYVDLEETVGLPTQVDKDIFTETIRNTIVPEKLQSSWENGNFNCSINDHLLVSTVEFYYVPDILKTDDNTLRIKLINFITDKTFGASTFMTSSYVSKHTPTFLYRFDYKTRTPFSDITDPVSMAHQFELPFFLGIPLWNAFSSIAWNNADRKVAENSMALFSNISRYIGLAFD